MSTISAENPLAKFAGCRFPRDDSKEFARISKSRFG